MNLYWGDDMNLNNFMDKLRYSYIYSRYRELYESHIRLWTNTIGIYFIELAGFFVILIAFFIYAINYKTTFIDPIETLKSSYMTILFTSMLISLLFTVICVLFSKSKETLISNLKIIIILTALTIFILLIGKITIDSTYNENEFSKIYSQIDFSEEETAKQYIDISLSSIKLSNHKELFIEQNLKAYGYFKLKTSLGLIVYTLLIGANIYLISHISRVQEMINISNRDAEILFDEEENLKF